MNRHNIFKAQKVAEELIGDARESSDVYGLTYGYLSLAMIMDQRSEYKQAIDMYKKVIEHMEKLNKDNVSKAQILYTIGKFHHKVNDFLLYSKRKGIKNTYNK